MYLIPVAVITMCVGIVYGQSSSCFTPDGMSGECIQVSQCKPILTLVNKPQKTDRDLVLLRKSHCGIEGRVRKVCCPKPLESEPVYSLNGPCNTPDGRPGKCVSINSCPQITNMLRPPVPQENKDFARNSRCNSPEPRTVCCGSPPEQVQSGDCKTQMTAFPPDPSSKCCGDSAGFGNKIYGGNETAIDEYPWAVLIEYTSKKYGTIGLFCGGALISGKYVLTAAHCITGPKLDQVIPKTVRLGEYDITNDGVDCVLAAGGGMDCTEGLTRIAIEKTIPHPKYNPAQSKRDDIGLIRMKETAPYTDFIRPVCLPTRDLTRPENTPPQFSLYAVGWGATEKPSAHSNVKLDVNVPFVSQEKCQPIYNTPGRTLTLWKGQLCAGGVEGQDTCKGDSGGPLVYENLNKFELTGIVSFGPTQCGQKGVPGIYSNVYEYLDWIKSVIVA